MSVDLDAEKYDHHRQAGEILTQVRAETVDRIEPGASHLEVATFAEERIRELGGKPAFPLNISIDEEAAHRTPSIDDEATFGEELVNIDIGVHVDGWIADSAVTVDLRGEHGDLVEASAAALAKAIELIEPGVSTATLGAKIEKTIEAQGFRPVANLTGHGLGRYEQHTDPTIPNRSVPEGQTLTAGDVVAIEPFATTGSGKVREGPSEEIFALETDGSIRNRAARKALEQITDEFRTLPFATRWLEGNRPEMALRRLKQRGLVEGYPVLRDTEGSYVSQKEHTVLVTDAGCEVLTRS